MSVGPAAGPPRVPTLEHAVPGPPAGPGVQPPFVAPPTDGHQRRRGWAIGLSVGGFAAFCVIGAVAVVGIFVLLYQVVRDEAQANVTTYLTALENQHYDAAYDQLCDDLKSTTSRAQFVQAEQQQPRIVDFQVGQTDLSGNEILVPASIDYANGRRQSVEFHMQQDRKTGGLEVCGVSG
jgi:hypothetical protein